MSKHMNRSLQLAEGIAKAIADELVKDELVTEVRPLLARSLRALVHAARSDLLFELSDAEADAERKAQLMDSSIAEGVKVVELL